MFLNVLASGESFQGSICNVDSVKLCIKAVTYISLAYVLTGSISSEPGRTQNNVELHLKSEKSKKDVEKRRRANFRGGSSTSHRQIEADGDE